MERCYFTILTSGFVGSSRSFLFLPDLVVRGEITGGALHPRRTRSCEDVGVYVGGCVCGACVWWACVCVCVCVCMVHV